MNGGLCTALSAAAITTARPSAPPGTSSLPSGAAFPGTVSSSSDEHAVVVADEVDEQLLERLVAQDRVLAPQQVDGGRVLHRPRASAPVPARSRIASTIRHTLTDPATSWTRTMRQPWATP